MPPFDFPELLLLDTYGGNFESYNAAVYSVFRNDFVLNKPVFQGKKLALKAHPIEDGKEYTYYHFTHDGEEESNRTPNLRRMERIPFPSPIINNSTHPSFKVWRNKRGSRHRILLFCEDESYLVVLEDRQQYILAWTAYYVEREHQKRKLLKEYEEYKKAAAAQ